MPVFTLAQKESEVDKNHTLCIPKPTSNRTTGNVMTNCGSILPCKT